MRKSEKKMNEEKFLLEESKKIMGIPKSFLEYNSRFSTKIQKYIDKEIEK